MIFLKNPHRKHIKQLIAALLSAVTLFTCAFAASAKRDENPLQNYDRMTVEGDDYMTLVFRKIWNGKEVRVPVESIYFSVRNGKYTALFITNAPSLYAFEGTISVVKMPGTSEIGYKFTVGRLTSSNAVPRTRFIEACNTAFSYMGMLIDYDSSLPKGASRNPYHGTVTADNVSLVVGFVAQLLDISDLPEEDYRTDKDGRKYFFWDAVYASGSCARLFKSTNDEIFEAIKNSDIYDPSEGKHGSVKVYPVGRSENYLDMKVSVKHEGDVWVCRETYWNKDGSTSSFTLKFGDDSKIISLIPDENLHPAGDVDGNGVTDIADAMLLLYHIAEKELLTEDQLGRAHSDIDWKVDIQDAMCLLYYIAGKTDSFFTPVRPASD